MWPNQMILRALINLTMSAPLIRRPRSALLRILHVLSPVRSGSNIFFKIRLQNKWGTFFLSSSLTIHLDSSNEPKYFRRQPIMKHRQSILSSPPPGTSDDIVCCVEQWHSIWALINMPVRHVFNILAPEFYI
jgi:hypothetical protein